MHKIIKVCIIDLTSVLLFKCFLFEKDGYFLILPDSNGKIKINY